MSTSSEQQTGSTFPGHEFHWLEDDVIMRKLIAKIIWDSLRTYYLNKTSVSTKRVMVSESDLPPRQFETCLVMSSIIQKSARRHSECVAELAELWTCTRWKRAGVCMRRVICLSRWENFSTAPHGLKVDFFANLACVCVKAHKNSGEFSLGYLCLGFHVSGGLYREWLLQCHYGFSARARLANNLRCYSAADCKTSHQVYDSVTTAFTSS